MATWLEMEQRIKKLEQEKLILVQALQKMDKPDQITFTAVMATLTCLECHSPTCTNQDHLGYLS